MTRDRRSQTKFLLQECEPGAICVSCYGCSIWRPKMALPTALPTGRSTCIVKACSFRIKTYGKYPLGYRHRLRCRQAKRVELLRANNGARSAATCIFEVAVPRKPLTCLKMAVSSLFMRRGGRDCGTASSAALSNFVKFIQLRSLGILKTKTQQETLKSNKN